jgi:xanthine/CO dehydrogenase XdhC/CoxF family maturation factor
LAGGLRPGAFDGADLKAGDFEVILTRGHLHDQNVLAPATGAGYVGMIGNRTKRRTPSIAAFAARESPSRISAGFTPLSAWPSAPKRRRKSP